jgi:hypothetical protein
MARGLNSKVAPRDLNDHSSLAWYRPFQFALVKMERDNGNSYKYHLTGVVPLKEGC